MDPSLRREDISRLVRQELESGASYSAVLVGLHDVWSEIRKDTAKSLHRFLSFKSEVLLQFISELQCAIRDTPPTSWQILHGSFLGLVSVYSNDSFQTNELTIQETCACCLLHIGHCNQPVREEAVLLLSTMKIFDTLPFQQLLISAFERFDDATPNCYMEGLLSCAISFLQNSTSLSRNAVVPILMLRMQSILSHSASTVRQLAGRILCSIYWEATTGVDLMEGSVCHPLVTIRSVYDALLRPHADDSGDDPRQWAAKEASLIAANEILNDHLQRILSILVNPEFSLERLTTHDESYLLSCFLGEIHRVEAAAIVHPQFEVRRAAIQLLPILTRLITLLNSPESNNTSISAYVNTFCSRFRDPFAADAKFNATGICTEVLQAVWVGEAVSNAELLLEAVNTEVEMIDADGLALPASVLNWANQINARLQEADARKEFLHTLRNCVNAQISTQRSCSNRSGDAAVYNFLVQKLVDFKSFLLTLSLPCLWRFDDSCLISADCLRSLLLIQAYVLRVQRWQHNVFVENCNRLDTDCDGWVTALYNIMFSTEQSTHKLLFSVMDPQFSCSAAISSLGDVNAASSTISHSSKEAFIHWWCDHCAVILPTWLILAKMQPNWIEHRLSFAGKLFRIMVFVLRRAPSVSLCPKTCLPLLVYLSSISWGKEMEASLSCVFQETLELMISIMPTSDAEATKQILLTIHNLSFVNQEERNLLTNSETTRALLQELLRLSDGWILQRAADATQENSISDAPEHQEDEFSDWDDDDHDCGVSAHLEVSAELLQSIQELNAKLTSLL